VFGAGPWRPDGVVGSTRYHPWELARRGWRVVYIEPPRAFLRRGRKWHAPDADFVAQTVPRVPPFAVRHAPPNALGEWWRRVTSRALARDAWLRAAERDCRPDAIWYGAPWHGHIRTYMERIWSPAGALDAGKKPPLHLFHVYDDLAESPILSPARRAMLRRWEDELLAACDVTLCSSMPQLEARRPRARRVELLQNAVADDFLEACKSGTEQEAARPFVERLRDLPGPRLVYGGVVDLRLDGAWFQALANAMPGASLVFLGYKEHTGDASFDRFLATHPRVHVFGKVPYAAYPALYQHADVLLLAHRDMAFTRGMYPEKLNEYLASGRPIVARDFAEVRRIAGESEHPGSVRLASSGEEWIAAVHDALLENDPAAEEARRALARRHAWSVEADRLHAMLMEARGLT
jgi:glycosyltransferase involved in cell wall biosynthesis